MKPLIILGAMALVMSTASGASGRGRDTPTCRSAHPPGCVLPIESTPADLAGEAAGVRTPPTVAAVSPTVICAGGPGFTMIVVGAGFLPSSQIQWNAATLATTFINPTQLSASVPASLTAVPGVSSVTVLNPGPGCGISNPVFLTIVGTSIASVSPSLIGVMSAGSPPVVVSVNGTGFTPGMSVFANGIALGTTYISPTQLQGTLWPTIPQALLPGALCINVQSCPGSASNTVALVVGGGGNTGTINTFPLATPPGQGFSLILEGATPSALLALVADPGPATPVPGWPTAAAGFVLGVGPPTGSASPLIPVLDSAGFLGAPTSAAAFDGLGRLVLTGFVRPNPPVALGITLQAAFLDLASPLGVRLTWARYPLDY